MSLCIYKHLYIYIYTYVCVYIYIYIYQALLAEAHSLGLRPEETNGAFVGAFFLSFFSGFPLS